MSDKVTMVNIILDTLLGGWSQEYVVSFYCHKLSFTMYCNALVYLHPIIDIVNDIIHRYAYK